MMDDLDLEELYRIDEERLLKYYERIKKRAQDQDEIHTLANFLEYESIGGSQQLIKDVFSYYQDKIIKSKAILDLAFEWIRAHKIRLKYKEYLVRSQFDNYELALDECIFLFFLHYDEYIRNIFKADIKEFEISTLYEVFFNSYTNQPSNFDSFLKKHRERVPTIFIENEKVNINIITLRSGLSEVILDDYESTLKSSKVLKKKKATKFKTPKKHQTVTSTPLSSKARFREPKKEADESFSGVLLQRLLKSCCISKSEISRKEMENALSQFLSSYFKFGKTYLLQDFKDKLILSLAKDIYDGFTESKKESFSIEKIKNQITDHLYDFVEKNEGKKLGGVAWKNDLKKKLTPFLLEVMETLLTT